MAEFCNTFTAFTSEDYWALPADQTAALIDEHNRRVEEQQKAAKKRARRR